MRSPAGLLWHAAGALAAPLLPLYLHWRARQGKEVTARLPERRGHAGVARAPAPLVWLHAASVGETLSILPLMEALIARRADLHLLVTTGTVTSAAVLGQRLPPALANRVIHRFAPLDVPSWAARFLDTWRPQLGVLVESELWPNLIAAARARRVPLALVNARVSARSAGLWARVPGLARALLGGFRLVLAQSEADAARLRGLGAPRAQCWGNLKFAARPLPADEAELERLRGLLGGRPVFLAASTHSGEEALVLVAHRILAQDRPDLLTVVVPRHPQRGEAVALEADGRLFVTGAGEEGRRVARRAAGEDPGPATAVYVADTLGELGLFYRLASVALVGGSLVEHGGQNPLEPARLGCPILLGPHVWNFAEVVDRLTAAGGAVRIPPGPDLAAVLAREAGDVLSEPRRGRDMATAAAAVAADQAGLPDRVAEALLALLSPAIGTDGRAEMVGMERD